MSMSPLNLPPSAWISDSYYITEDTESHLNALVRRFLKGQKDRAISTPLVEQEGVHSVKGYHRLRQEMELISAPKDQQTIAGGERSEPPVANHESKALKRNEGFPSGRQ